MRPASLSLPGDASRNCGSSKIHHWLWLSQLPEQFHWATVVPSESPHPRLSMAQPEHSGIIRCAPARSLPRVPIR